jgi:hypothetical protein
VWVTTVKDGGDQNTCIRNVQTDRSKKKERNSRMWTHTEHAKGKPMKTGNLKR